MTKKIRYIMNLRIFMVILAGAFVYSCTEKDPFPLPGASFEVYTLSPEKHLPVRFENRSTNAISYLWDFGDGSATSTEIVPQHTYNKAGDFIVSLTAYSEDDQMSTETRVVKIGQRYLTGMYIININMKDGTGKPWDNDGTGPDVLMQFGPTDFVSEDEIEGFFVESLNIGEFETPIGINTTDLLSADYQLNNKEYFILLEDRDIVQNDTTYTTMIELNFNPVVVSGESVTEVKRKGGTGDLTIPFVVFDEYQFFLEFEIR